MSTKKDKIMGTKKWIYWISIGTVLILIYKFLDNFTGIGTWISNLLSVLAPFLSAILISYVLYKPCAKIEKILSKKTKHARGISVFIVYLITAILLILTLKFIIPALIDSIIDLIKNIQTYYNGITTNEIEEAWAPFVKDNILKPLVEYIQSIEYNKLVEPNKIWEYISSAFGIVKFIFNCFIAIVCSIYILLERTEIVKFIKRTMKALLSKKRFKRFNNYFTKGNQIFFDFVTSQVIDAIVVSILMSVILLILDVKYAILLGVMIGVFNLIPYFGAIIAVVVASLITVLTGGWQQALLMIVVITIVQQIDANIINPKITGSRLNVSPLLVIFSVTLGGAYFGVIGMFIAVPTAVLIKLIVDDYIDIKEKRKEEE
ncbi:MAG: AI-2E family transporter [Clostridia bacterium]|nr:AI-2E family transporter [Clostridia bacterium]